MELSGCWPNNRDVLLVVTTRVALITFMQLHLTATCHET